MPTTQNNKAMSEVPLKTNKQNPGTLMISFRLSSSDFFFHNSSSTDFFSDNSSNSKDGGGEPVQGVHPWDEAVCGAWEGEGDNLPQTGGDVWPEIAWQKAPQ